MGNDTLVGGIGADTLNGEDGAEGLRGAGTDWWRPFTSAGLQGGDDNDIINGGAGEDYIDGGLGADTINGGADFDGVTYETSASAVTVNLKTGTGLGGSAQGDILSDIEYLRARAAPTA